MRTGARAVAAEWLPYVIVAAIILTSGGISVWAILSARDAQHRERVTQSFNNWHQSSFEQIYERLWAKTATNEDIEKLFGWIEHPAFGDEDVNQRVRMRAILALTRFKDYPNNHSLRIAVTSRIDDNLRNLKWRRQLGSIPDKEVKTYDAMVAVRQSLDKTLLQESKRTEIGLSP